MLASEDVWQWNEEQKSALQFGQVGTGRIWGSAIVVPGFVTEPCSYLWSVLCKDPDELVAGLAVPSMEKCRAQELCLLRHLQENRRKDGLTLDCEPGHSSACSHLAQCIVGQHTSQQHSGIRQLKSPAQQSAKPRVAKPCSRRSTFQVVSTPTLTHLIHLILLSC